MKTRVCLATALFAAAVMHMPAAGQSAAQRDKQLARADHKASIEGDLKGAIEEYRRIAAGAGSNRELAAEALVRMAECHQKLGDADARAVYQRVVREFADQRDHVARARAGLAALEGPRAAASTGIVSRQIWTGPQVDALGSISPDGRSLSFVDWETGDLAVRDVSTGANRRLTNKGSWNDSTEFALFSRISPDGTLVAYNWMRKDFGWDIRVGPVDGGPHRTVFSTKVNEDYVHPDAWSPDGRHLALLRVTPEANEIVLLPVSGGQVRVLKAFDRRPPTRSLFSPDGRHLAYELATVLSAPERDIHLVALDGSSDTPLITGPADDYLLGWLPGGRILFASDRAGTIDAWSAEVVSGKAQAPVIAKKDLGSVDAIGVTRRGSLFYALRATGPDVYRAPLNARQGAAPPVRVPTRFIGTNVDPEWSPDGRQVAFISERAFPPGRAGARVLCIADLETGKQRELPANGTRPRWSPDGRSILVRLSGAGHRGLQRVDAATGAATLIVTGPVQSARWSRDGGTLFILRTDYGRPGMTGQDSWIAARNMKTGDERELFRESVPSPVGDALLNDLSISPDGTLLALTAMRDRNKVVMVLPVAGGQPREVFRPTADFTIPNFSGLTWTPDGKEIVFVKGSAAVTGGNMRRAPTEVWAIPLRGGQPRPLGIAAEGLQQPQIHPGTRQLLYQSGIRTQEIWVLENLKR